MKKSTESLGRLVRRVREANGWTLMDVVKNSGHKITSGYVSMIETGQVTAPSPEKLKALAAGLRVGTDFLTSFVMELPSEYSEEEQLLVSYFRQADDRGRRDLLLFAKQLRDALVDDQQPDQPALSSQAKPRSRRK